MIGRAMPARSGFGGRLCRYRHHCGVWRRRCGGLRRLAEQSGFTITGFVAAAPRQEANQPVEGFAVALTKGTF